MKFFKKEKRHLSKYKKAKPTIRRSVIRNKILLQREACVYGTIKRKEMIAERWAYRIDYLGASLIKAMEWGWMRKRLDRETRHLPKGKRLEKQKEIAELWMEGQSRMKGIEL